MLIIEYVMMGILAFGLLRGLRIRLLGAIYALIACAALALALFSCSPPPAQQQPTPTAVPDFAQLSSDVSFIQITAGNYHACGLQTDGTALRSGCDINGSLKVRGENLT